MKTLQDVAEALESQRQRKRLKYTELADATGLSVLAVRQALQGKTQIRVTSLLALADRLEFELVLLPKVVARSMSNSTSDHIKPVTTSVERVLQQHKSHWRTGT